MASIISGATIIDGVSEKPIEGKSILIEDGRIKAIDKHSEFVRWSSAERIEAQGKYIIPGLMDANVHLLVDLRMENLVRHEGRYEEIIAEAAQVALRSGFTTVFDTFGPRRPLVTVRDRINAGDMPGSRIFCAGNIIGLDGPFSADFFPKTMEVASGSLIERINALWCENVGAHLMWMTPEQVVDEVRAYLSKGIDFIKYASSDHRSFGPNFLVFSPLVQTGIAKEAHCAGLTAQAHTTTVESLRTAIEAGVDIIQHCNFTGPTPIPDSTLELLLQRKVASTVLPFTQRRYEWAKEKSAEHYARHLAGANSNVGRLIRSGAALLLATDAGVFAPDVATDPVDGKFLPGVDNLFELGQGHIHWLKAMEEQGFPPMESLKAATRNIALAYGKEKDLGTLEPGKIADLLILDRNPLQSAENYRSIQRILKDGRIVDHGALPVKPILTRPSGESSAEVLAYRASRNVLALRYPLCC